MREAIAGKLGGLLLSIYRLNQTGESFKAEARQVGERALKNVALQYLMENGGSAYLPERLAAAHVDAGRLHPVEGAPEFERPVYAAIRQERTQTWPWFETVLGNAMNAD